MSRLRLMKAGLWRHSGILDLLSDGAEMKREFCVENGKSPEPALRAF